MCTICRRYWHCCQYPSTIVQKSRAVFQCLRKAGLKLSMTKCHFGVQKIDFLGRTITTKRVALQKQKVIEFLEKVKFPRSKKALQRHIGFFNFNRNYIPRLAERLNRSFNYSKQRMPKPEYRLPLIS